MFCDLIDRLKAASEEKYPDRIWNIEFYNNMLFLWAGKEIELEKECNLCIYRMSNNMDFVANFYCNDIYFAETIVNAFIKANKKINMNNTIYFKNNNHVELEKN